MSSNRASSLLPSTLPRGAAMPQFQQVLFFFMDGLLLLLPPPPFPLAEWVGVGGGSPLYHFPFREKEGHPCQPSHFPHNQQLAAGRGWLLTYSLGVGSGAFTGERRRRGQGARREKERVANARRGGAERGELPPFKMRRSGLRKGALIHLSALPLTHERGLLGERVALGCSVCSKY